MIMVLDNDKRINYCGWDHRQQALASILFDKTIDPIVRRLLVLNDLRRQNVVMPMELERCNQVKQLLHTLRMALNEIINTVTVKNDGEMTNDTKDDLTTNDNMKKYWKSRVQNQICGIAVPLFNVLQHLQPPLLQKSNNSTGGGGGDSNNELRMNNILQSAIYACIEEAALCTTVLWSCRQRIFKDNDDDGDMNSLILPGLVSCAMALSSLDIATTNCGGKPTNNLDEEKALDTGEECALAILRCIQSFLSCCPPLASSSSSSPPSLSFDSVQIGDVKQKLEQLATPMAREIGDAMGGALVARLVQTCLTLLPKESVINTQPNSSSNNIGSSPTLQLEALQTLQDLMTSIPIENLWRAILPGCFAGLYRCALSKLRYSSSASTHKIASAAILALSLLLRQSTRSIAKVTDALDNSTRSITATLLAAVEHSNFSVRKTNGDLIDDVKCRQTSSESNEQDAEFEKEVNSRLPGPLSILLSLISTNSSNLVRRKGLFLCYVILVETQSIWAESTSNTLGKKALEYCLTNLNDDDDDLSDYSWHVLNEHKSQLGAIEWKRQLSQNTVPTILELLEMIPILVKSGRDVEVRNHLRVIDGYLLISFRDKEKQSCLGKGKSEIGAALSCAEAATVIQDAFSVIFVPDTESMTYRPMVEAFSPDGNEVTITGDYTRIRFLHLQDETINAARQTARLFARTFGIKRCAFIIDSCIADVFESCSRRYQHHSTSFTADMNSAQTNWSGCIIYCTELLKEFDKDSETKRSSKHTKVLSSLASSVFALIVSEPLWTLRTTLDGQQKLGSKSMIESVRRGDGVSVCEDNSTTVMNANAILHCTLLGFICQFARVLGQDIKLHLQIILLPLLEKASHIGNHSYVQNLAVSSLVVVSKAANCSDMYSFVAINFDYLLDAVSIRVRKHAKERSIMPRSLMGVINVVLRSAIHHGNIASDVLGSSHLSLVDHILTCLLHYFDRQYDAFMNQQSYLDTVCVFRSIISFVDESITEQSFNNAQSILLESDDHATNRWLLRLNDELKLGHSSYLEDNNIDLANDTNAEEEEDSITSDNITDAKFIEYANEIRTVNAILSRCSYLVCTENIKIQILGCETILAGFRCLWKIGAFRASQRGESVSNPLLPAISELWPTIIRRLRAASASYASLTRNFENSPPIRHMMARDQNFEAAQATVEALISKYLEIISELCTLSDGFFSDRFENDVYPVIAQLLQSSERRNCLLEDCRQSHTSKRHVLLVSVLDCLRHTFESNCGRELVSLIPTCGSMLFPLLSDDHIGDAIVETIKVMLKIDCGALWRGLHILSGRSSPQNPLCRTIAPSCDLVIRSKEGLDKDVPRQKQNAERLLDFIDSLEEQPLS